MKNNYKTKEKTTTMANNNQTVTGCWIRVKNTDLSSTLRMLLESGMTLHQIDHQSSVDYFKLLVSIPPVEQSPNESENKQDDNLNDIAKF